MTTLRLLGWIALAAALAVAGSAYREHARRARLDAIVAAQRQLSTTPLAPAGSAPRAGISARAAIVVRPVPESLARRLHGDADFHHFVHRCGVCHSTPDPALHEAGEWDAVLERMADNIRTAGLLPLGAVERAAVQRVLRRYALNPQRARATPPGPRPPVRR